MIWKRADNDSSSRSAFRDLRALFDGPFELVTPENASITTILVSVCSKSGIATVTVWVSALRLVGSEAWPMDFEQSSLDPVRVVVIDPGAPRLVDKSRSA